MFGVVERGVVVNFEVLVVLVIHQLFKLFTKEMDFAEIKRPKICKKRLIYQVIINTKVKSVLTRFRRCFVGDPVKPLRNNLHRLVITDRGSTVA